MASNTAVPVTARSDWVVTRGASNQRSRQSGARPSSRASPRSSSPLTSPRGAMRGSWYRKIGAWAAAASRLTTSADSKARSSVAVAARPSQRAMASMSSSSPRSIAATRRVAASAVDAKSVVGGLGHRGSEVLELVGDRGDPAAGLLPVRRLHGGEQRGPGHELERRVQHERVGLGGARHGEHLADLGDEPGVGRLVGPRGSGRGRRGLRHRHAEHPKTSSSLEVKGKLEARSSGGPECGDARLASPAIRGKR